GGSAPAEFPRWGNAGCAVSRAVPCAMPAFLPTWKLSRAGRNAEGFLDQIRSEAFGGDGDETDGARVRLDIRQADAAQDVVERALGLRFRRLVQHDIHDAFAERCAGVVGQFMADEQDLPAPWMAAQHADQRGI